MIPTTLRQNGASASAPTFPTPTGYVAMGDSRQFGAGGYTQGSTTLTTSNGRNLALGGWLAVNAGNKLLRVDGGQMGVNSSTTLRQLDSLNSVSVATTGNPAGAAYPTGTGQTADLNYNPGSSGAASALSNSGNVWFYMPSGVNDAGPQYYLDAGPITSMTLMANIIDQGIAAGKVVILGDEIPRGYTSVYSESHTVASATFTASHTTDFMVGDDFGMTGSVVDVKGNVLTKVASSPGVGQYSVTSGGVFTVDSGLNGLKVFISYTYGATPTPSYQLTIHNWLHSSSASPFVDPDSGVSYAIAGALHGRPQVIPLNMWEALIDPTSGSNYYAKRGYSTDGTHGTQTGGLALKANTQAAMAYAGWDTLPSKSKIVNANNWAAASTTNAVTSYGPFTPPGVMAGYAFGKTQVRVVTSTLNIVAKETSPGVLTGTGFSSGTVNTSTGAISFVLSANPGAGGQIILEQSPTNLLLNPMFDLAQGTVALPANWTGSLLPSGYKMTPDAGTITAATTSASAGGLDCAVAYQTINGKNYMAVSMHGNPGTGTATTFAVNANPLLPGSRFNVSTPDSYRIEADMLVGPGQDGFLYGFISPEMTGSISQSAATIPQTYNATLVSSLNTSTGLSTSGQPFNGQMLGIENPIQVPLISDLISTNGMAVGTLFFGWNIVMRYSANTPMSFTVYIALPSAVIRND